MNCITLRLDFKLLSFRFVALNPLLNIPRRRVVVAGWMVLIITRRCCFCIIHGWIKSRNEWGWGPEECFGIHGCVLITSHCTQMVPLKPASYPRSSVIVVNVIKMKLGAQLSFWEANHTRPDMRLSARQQQQQQPRATAEDMLHQNA